MKKWDYMTITFINMIPHDFDRSLANAGKNGWELSCTISGKTHLRKEMETRIVFKREIPKPQKRIRFHFSDRPRRRTKKSSG